MKTRRAVLAAAAVSTLSLCGWGQEPATTFTQRPAPATQDKVVETPAAKKLKAENQRMAKDLLNRAYGITKNFSDSDRAFVVARLAQTGARALPEQSKAWGEEVFQITSGLDADTQRGSDEMNAVMAVAENDPDRALQLLLLMMPGKVTDDGRNIPDMRPPAATMLFQKYWQKRGEEGLPTLQSTARQMGEAGFYPYMAMGAIIRQVNRKDQDKARAITNEALSYFTRLKKNDMTGQQVAMFLRSNRELISAPMMKDVLTQLVNDALATKDTPDGAMMTSISTNGNTTTLTGAANLMLYQLMPLIKEVDADWAKKLEEQNTELRGAALAQASAPSGNNRVQVGMTIGGGGPGGTANAMEEMKVAQVDELAQRDPQEALKMAGEINNPVLRAAAGARLAGELSNSNPEQAAALVKAAKDAMAATSEPADKLRILVGLAQAQAAMKDKEGLAATFEQGFAMADDLYRKSVDKSPSAPIMSRPGIESLNRLTATGVKFDSRTVLARIDNLHSQILQVMMMISAAEGLDPEMKQPDSGFRVMIRNS